MISKNELLSNPNYLLTKYQNEIYRQLINFMENNNLSQKEVAKKLGVSGSYVSQVLNGNFNFTLRKLIELGLMIDKVPLIDFIELDEFWVREKENVQNTPTISINVSLNFPASIIQSESYSSLPNRGNTFTELSGGEQYITLDSMEFCPN